MKKLSLLFIIVLSINSCSEESCEIPVILVNNQTVDFPVSDVNNQVRHNTFTTGLVCDGLLVVSVGYTKTCDNGGIESVQHSSSWLEKGIEKEYDCGNGCLVSEIWYLRLLERTVDISTFVEVTFQSSVSNVIVNIASYQNVNQNNPILSYTNSGEDVPLSTIIVNTDPKNMVIDNLYTKGECYILAGANQTEISNTANGNRIMGNSFGISIDEMSWNIANTPFTHTALVLEPGCRDTCNFDLILE